MKKYLMTGIAALAMCAAFTSCSKDTEFEQITPEQTVQANYDAAFIKAFGQPAANQTWGFGTNTTRAFDVNGNEWHTAKYNLEYDAPVTTAEKNMVFNYVNNTANVETVDQITFTQYWVTQIWNGKKDQNTDGAKAPNSESYPDQNGTKYDIVGGEHMDWLMISETAGTWTHCNNFNAADNQNYNEGGEGGRTLMKESGTLSFGYTNSHSSYFSTKYIIVPGEKIDDSLAGFYYVCFDFERGYTEEEWAAEKSYGTCSIWKSQPTDQDPDAGYWQNNENWELQGFHNDANSADLKSALETLKGTKVKDITFKGYLNGKDFCDGDDNYTDWIVRISPAELKYDGRIMGEDLSAEESGDFDFNDVVFDYRLNNDETATVKLRAAGGTLELYVGGEANADKTAIINGHEVHAEFGVGIGTMVNTGVATGTEDPAPFSVACKDNDPINIKIWVKKGTTFMELTAHTGKPASKFKTKTTTKWCDEYISIINPYPSFATWVGDPNTDWTTPFHEKYADKDLTNNGDAIKGRM